MRINIYAQELILQKSAIEYITKAGTNAAGEAELFCGVRMYLHSPAQLHDLPEDDDRSAITIWLPRALDKRARLAENLQAMAAMVRLMLP